MARVRKIKEEPLTDKQIINQAVEKHLIETQFNRLKQYGSYSFLSDWEAVALLGKGTFGTVFKARRTDGDTVRYSAIKIIEASSNETLKPLYSEIEALSSLKNCPNIVKIEDFSAITVKDPNVSHVLHYLAIRMELLQSLDLEGHKFTHTEIMKIGADLCETLIYCHGQEKPIIHCDIKPTNILVDGSGNYKLADFGEAKQLRNSGTSSSSSGTAPARSGKSSNVKGSYPFMAPEVWKGESYDQRADLYSLGCTLYALYNNGYPPFFAEFLASKEYERNGIKGWPVFRESRGDARIPRLKGVNSGTMTIIRRLCHYKADERFNSAEEVQRLLNAPKKEQREARSHLHAWRRFARGLSTVAVVWAILIAAAGLIFSAILVSRQVFINKSVSQDANQVNSGSINQNDDEASIIADGFYDDSGEIPDIRDQFPIDGGNNENTGGGYTGGYTGGYDYSSFYLSFDYLQGYINDNSLSSDEKSYYTIYTENGKQEVYGTKDEILSMLQNENGKYTGLSITTFDQDGGMSSSYTYIPGSEADGYFHEHPFAEGSDTQYSEPSNNVNYEDSTTITIDNQQQNNSSQEQSVPADIPLEGE